MKKYFILYNSKSGNGTGKQAAEKVLEHLSGGEHEFIDVTSVKSYEKLFESLDKDDVVVLCGGDGTLNHFANDVQGIEIKNKVLHFGTGTGNDFLHDIGAADGKPAEINKYIKKLPTVCVNGVERKFINGIGYGIDGYCCEVGDKLRATGDKPINYTSIAIKGLLFHYKPTNATVTVDGVEKKFKKVWIAPTMNGRYYGGGMIPTPDQDRLNNDTVSTMIMYGKGKIKTLMVFPSIFKGEHIKHKNMVEVFTGRNVTVEFDRPTALQIDGETVLGVTKYSVTAAKD